ncbi:hypothetical protein VPH35_043589 [Triticum aestivum]
MEKGGASGPAAMTAAGDAKEQHEGEARPPKQYTAAQLTFFWALHTYDEDKEWQKRFARVAKQHPHAWPKHMVAEIEEYITYLDEDEDDFRIGLYSLIGDEITD